MSEALRQARRIVVKVGSSLVTDEGRGLDAEAIGTWCAQLAALAAQKRQLVMVSSGAIAEGMKRLGWARRPAELHELQAAAAVGQMGLAQIYETQLRRFGLGSAQVLLTHADLADRERYLNARSTLLTLLGLNVIPVINENDTVVNDEIKFGDNDTLGALVTNLVEADALVILTDQAGLYDADPRTEANARHAWPQALSSACRRGRSRFLRRPPSARDPGRRRGRASPAWPRRCCADPPCKGRPDR
jgi:glutamate 5-kinase